ncbi:MAG TPA: hypothetical protein V6C84_06760 [Coleofasciculaceae cyanobacterium]|jgi:hypothetical protein
MTTGNAKNQLLQLLQDLGCPESYATFKSENLSPSGIHHSIVTVTFPDGRQVCGIGKGQRITYAEVAAAQEALDVLHSHYPDLIVNWDEINVEAQAGDALIKLAAYRSNDTSKASEKSQLLQQWESDNHLERMFDIWKSQGDPDLEVWGDNLGQKHKATLVEALLWRRFGAQVLAADAPLHLQTLLKIIVLD